jgi:ABC-type multidrug transport system fused ATPase/permease subunit
MDDRRVHCPDPDNRCPGQHLHSGLVRVEASRPPRDQKGFNDIMSNFWDLLTLLVSTFLFVAYLFVLFQIVTDLFRDTETGGVAKAIWIVGLIFLPMLTAIVYIIARGKGMAARQQASLNRMKSESESYIRQVAGRSPAADIAEAKSLLDAGTITQAEFERLKAKALS